MSNITCAQLGAAIEAAEAAGLDRDGPTMHTLDALIDALTLHATRDSDAARVTDGDLPVTVEQLDEAIAELRDPEVRLSRRHIKSLQSARDLLAHEAARRATAEAAEGGGVVTRAEFSAWARAVAFALSDCEAAVRRAGFPDGNMRHRLRERVGTRGSGAIGELVALLEDIADRDGAHARKRAQGKPSAVLGGNGFNY